MSEHRRVASTPLDATTLMTLPGARRSVFLMSLSAEDRESVVASASTPRFEAQDPISSRHAPDDALHVLLQGAAIERSWPSRGDESFARPIAAGDLIGLTNVVLQPGLAWEVRALVRCMTLRIPGPSARALLESAPGVSMAMARSAVVALSVAEVDRVVLATGDAMTRITRRITELAVTWGTTAPEGVEIDLPVTQEQLGAWAGVSRETTVKCLHWLRDRDLIETARRHIRVRDLSALEDLGRRRGAAMVMPRQPRPGPRSSNRR